MKDKVRYIDRAPGKLKKEYFILFVHRGINTWIQCITHA